MLTRMAFKANKVSLALLLLSLLVLLYASLALAKQDPELKQCEHQCKHQRQFDEQQKERCERSCEEYYREKREREKEREVNSIREEESYDEREEREDEEQEEEDNNPYVFDDEDFETRVETEEGSVRSLERFTQRSKLLRGLKNYRVAILEANPHAFISPHHYDAHLVLFVADGEATISLVRDEKRKSFNLGPGDIIGVPAGTPFYMINRNENKKLYIVQFIQAVSIPGKFEAFYGPGGEDPESFYSAFSREVLEAALKAPRSQLDKLFHKQREGSIRKASKEQIRALSQHKQGTAAIWPFGRDSSGPFNLFNKYPSQSNQFGSLYEAFPDDYKQLQDLDISVAFANITRGSMAGPFYYSSATKITVVVDGEGYFEMACPHLSSSGSSRGQRGGSGSSQSQKSSPRYKKVSGRLRPGVVFVTPASHPVAVIASQNSNLQVVCFEVNAKGNIRYLLAGKGNILSKFEAAAKELAFGLPSREVERILERQDHELFFEGPNKQQEKHGRAFE